MNKTFVASISLYAIFALHANAQALPAAPAEWTYSAIPTVSTNTQPTFTAWPTISIPASTGVKHVVDCISVEIGVTNGQSGYYTVLQLEDGVGDQIR